MLSKKIFLKISAVAIMIGYSLLLVGVIIAFSDISFDGLSEVVEVKVVRVDKKEIVIDYTEYNNGDYLEKKLKKPIYVKPKAGDIIHVRYPVKRPEKMHYIINSKTGIKIMSIGIKVEFFAGLSASIYILLMRLIKMYKKKNKRMFRVISYKKR